MNATLHTIYILYFVLYKCAAQLKQNIMLKYFVIYSVLQVSEWIVNTSNLKSIDLPGLYLKAVGTAN